MDGVTYQKCRFCRWEARRVERGEGTWGVYGGCVRVRRAEEAKEEAEVKAKVLYFK